VTTQVLVDDLADVRAGDKGDSLMISVLPRDAAAHQILREHLTADVVEQRFAPLVTGEVRRHELPQLPAFIFFIPGVLGGGVTGSTALDGHGKALSYHLLGVVLGLDDPYVPSDGGACSARSATVPS
jgi:hypothetical protein